jgi:hypothetical protein
MVSLRGSSRRRHCSTKWSTLRGVLTTLVRINSHVIPYELGRRIGSILRAKLEAGLAGLEESVGQSQEAINACDWSPIMHNRGYSCS